MIKKIAFGIFLSIGLGVFLAWLYRSDLVLTLVSLQTTLTTTVDSNRSVPWQREQADPVEDNNLPNIIFILADDLGYNDISTFGGGLAGGKVKTPHIDQLARDGAIFRQAYAGNATCAPSRAMLMTGRYPTKTGYEFTPTPSGMASVVSMLGDINDDGRPPGIFDAEIESSKPPFEDQGLPSEEITIAELLQSKGYYTAHIGKWHLGRGEGMRPNDQGFVDSLLMANGLYLPEDHPDVVNAKLDFDPIDKFLWARMRYAASFNNGGTEMFAPKGYLTDYWTDEAIQVIENNQSRPFFLYLAHWGPHTPLQALKRDYDAVGDIKPHRLRVYAAMVRAIDRSVGKITNALKSLGLEQNTLVVFSSDNGGAGYVGLPEINAPFRGWKLTNFEGGLRAPMFLKWPAEIPPNTSIDVPVAHIDVAPTLAAAAQVGVPPELELDGTDMMAFLDDPEGSKDLERTLFWQSGHYRVVRKGDWKLQVSDNPAKKWLFNLKEDPTEQNNLAETRSEVTDELSALLDQHASGRKQPLYPSVAQIPVTVDKTLAEKYEETDELIYWPN